MGKVKLFFKIKKVSFKDFIGIYMIPGNYSRIVEILI